MCSTGKRFEMDRRTGMLERGTYGAGSVLMVEAMARMVSWINCRVGRQRIGDDEDNGDDDGTIGR